MKRLAFLAIASGFLFQFCSKDNLSTETKATETNAADRGATVTVPAGSLNALAAAVAQAGPSGTVILKAGEHSESGTVTIPFSLNLVGETGAVLRAQTTPSTNEWLAQPQRVEPVLYIKDALGSRVENIEINTPGADPGNMGILVEDSDGFILRNCKVKNHQAGIIVVRSGRGLIEGCVVAGNTSWQTGAFSAAYGINMVSGDHNRLIGNESSGNNAGIFVSGKNGILQRNYLHDNNTGVIFCTFPQNFFELPGGQRVKADHSAHAWKAINNKAVNNFEIGLLVIDGANANVLLDNECTGNVYYDIVLTGDLPDYLWVTFPPSKYNLVKSTKYPATRIKNCGIGNVIIGGTEVDYGLDPC